MMSDKVLAEWLAGPNWGSHFMPRIGDEVLIDFIDARWVSVSAVSPDYIVFNDPHHSSGAHHV